MTILNILMSEPRCIKWIAKAKDHIPVYWAGSKYIITKYIPFNDSPHPHVEFHLEEVT